MDLHLQPNQTRILQKNCEVLINVAIKESPDIFILS